MIPTLGSQEGQSMKMGRVKRAFSAGQVFLGTSTILVGALMITTIHSLSTAQASIVPPSPSVSGVQAGILTQGEMHESWVMVGTDRPDMNSPGFDGKSNLVPVDGTWGDYTGDLVVELAPDTDSDTHWKYSVPCRAGHFSATITVPYHGDVWLTISKPTFENKGTRFVTGENYAYTELRITAPALPEQDASRLQSWQTNYNESDEIRQICNQIVKTMPQRGNPTQMKDAAIKQVSDWVSRNIRYNMPLYQSGFYEWQQGSTTVQKKVGVCEDECAVAAALLRNMGIPTKLISGLAVTSDGGVAHAWNEAWDGKRWVIFDPTWDQVYTTDQTGVVPPAKITDEWFDPPADTFSQTHIMPKTMGF